MLSSIWDEGSWVHKSKSMIVIFNIVATLWIEALNIVPRSNFLGGAKREKFGSTAWLAKTAPGLLKFITEFSTPSVKAITYDFLNFCDFLS